MASEKTNGPSSRYADDIHNTHQRLPSPRHIHNSADSVLPYPDTLLSALNLLDPIPPATNRAFTLADLSPKNVQTTPYTFFSHVSTRVLPLQLQSTCF